MNLANMEFSFCTRLKMYFIEFFGCTDCCKRRDKEFRDEVNIVNEGTDLLMDNLNLLNVLSNLK